jgi:hypothetical protein
VLADHFLFERVSAAGLGYDFVIHDKLIIASGRQLRHRRRRNSSGSVEFFEVIPQYDAATDFIYTLGL